MSMGRDLIIKRYLIVFEFERLELPDYETGITAGRDCSTFRGDNHENTWYSHR